MLEIVESRNPGRMVAAGKAVKICHGLYVNAAPEPKPLAEVLCRRWPDAALDGYSAARNYLGYEQKFPIHLIRAKGLKDSPYVNTRRARPKDVFPVADIPTVNPLQAVEIMEQEHAIHFLEKLMRGRDGPRQLGFWKQSFTQYPAHTRHILDQAIIGADSLPERSLSRRLRPLFDVRNNHKVGHYHWDIALVEHKIAIEVDGYAYHHGENRATFEKDRLKLNDAVHRGWRPLHYTAYLIEHYLDRVVGQIVDIVRGGREYLPGVWMWHPLCDPSLSPPH